MDNHSVKLSVAWPVHVGFERTAEERGPYGAAKGAGCAPNSSKPCHDVAAAGLASEPVD